MSSLFQNKQIAENFKKQYLHTDTRVSTNGNIPTGSKVNRSVLEKLDHLLCGNDKVTFPKSRYMAGLLHQAANMASQKKTSQSTQQITQNPLLSQSKIEQNIPPLSMINNSFPLRNRTIHRAQIVRIPENLLSTFRNQTGNRSLFQTNKIKRYEPAVNLISQSLILKNQRNILKANTKPNKMPNLNKIKLKKQLQNMQRSQNFVNIQIFQKISENTQQKSHKNSKNSNQLDRKSQGIRIKCPDAQSNFPHTPKKVNRMVQTEPNQTSSKKKYNYTKLDRHRRQVDQQTKRNNQVAKSHHQNWKALDFKQENIIQKSSQNEDKSGKTRVYTNSRVHYEEVLVARGNQSWMQFNSQRPSLNNAYRNPRQNKKKRIKTQAAIDIIDYPSRRIGLQLQGTSFMEQTRQKTNAYRLLSINNEIQTKKKCQRQALNLKKDIAKLNKNQIKIYNANQSVEIQKFTSNNKPFFNNSIEPWASQIKFNDQANLFLNSGNTL